MTIARSPSHRLVLNQFADYRCPLEMASVDSRQLRAMMSMRFKACWATKYGVQQFHGMDKEMDGDTFDALISKVEEKDCVIFNSFVAELLKVFDLSDLDFGVSKVDSQGRFTLRFWFRRTRLILGILLFDTDIGHIVRGSFGLPQAWISKMQRSEDEMVNVWSEDDGKFKHLEDMFYENWNHESIGGVRPDGTVYAPQAWHTQWIAFLKWQEKAEAEDIEVRQKMEDISKQITALYEAKEQLAKSHIHKLLRLQEILENNEPLEKDNG